MNEAKQKAQKLVRKFETAIVEELEGGDRMFKYTAKQCALILCDEILFQYETLNSDLINGLYRSEKFVFWQSVKTAINEL